LNSKLRIGWDPARADYDTPFYTGNPNRGKQKYPNNVVCIANTNRCDKQSHINYFAQGMYSAAAGESLDDALKWTMRWNQYVHGEIADPAELWWTTYGWYNYTERKDCEDGKLDHSYPSEWLIYECNLQP